MEMKQSNIIMKIWTWTVWCLAKKEKKAKIDEILQYTVDEWKRKKHKHFKLRLSAGVQSNLNWAKKKHLREKKKKIGRARKRRENILGLELSELKIERKIEPGYI